MKKLKRWSVAIKAAVKKAAKLEQKYRPWQGWAHALANYLEAIFITLGGVILLMTPCYFPTGPSHYWWAAGVIVLPIGLIAMAMRIADNLPIRVRIGK